MVCEKCHSENAIEHFSGVDHLSGEKYERHFCSKCADAFILADPILSPARGPMIHFRVLDVSAERTTVEVLNGKSTGEKWGFLTSRLKDVQIDPCKADEFSMQADDGWIEWLKGNRETPS
jgi:hypothetical protein